MKKVNYKVYHTRDYIEFSSYNLEEINRIIDKFENLVKNEKHEDSKRLLSAIVRKHKANREYILKYIK